MKILQVSNYLVPVHGGSAEVPFQLSKALVKNGQDVTIYTSNLGMDESVLLPGVTINAFKTSFNTAGFNITPDMIGKARDNFKNFDVIHLHNYRTFQNIVAYHYAKKYRIPYVLQAHGSLTTFFQKAILKRAFDVLWGHCILGDAARVIALNEMEAAQCRSLGVHNDKIEIVPNGIDLVEFEHLPPRGVFRKRYAIDDNLQIVLFLGRLNRIKGLDLLVRAFAGSLKESGNVKLVIVGPDDGFRPTLEALVRELSIEKEVLFTGPLYGAERLSAYVDAEVYVLSSFYDTFPLTVLEALACSIPVIVTDRCGLADFIRESAGLVVPYDKGPLKDALSKMLDNPSLRLEYGTRGRELIKEQYNWPIVASQVESIYKAVIRDRP
jgi:glycosyltransferase involved in cell wall biosynthesis